jgi:amidophosphoribosyltransferase
MIEGHFFNEECGVFGITGSKDAAKRVYLGLYALQHRGQEAAGIASTDGEKIFTHKGAGLVGEVFRDSSIFDRLTGNMAIGHNRYSTAGGTSTANAQPFTVTCKSGWLSAAHNGNLVNAEELRLEMEEKGSIFTATSDTEVFLHLIAKSNCSIITDQIKDALSKVKGAYSVLFLTPCELYAIRDPLGIRPLCIGKHEAEDGRTEWAVASESCAFDLTGFEYVRTVEPGEIVILSERRVPKSVRLFYKPMCHAGCVFEYIYFSRPDSLVFDIPVDAVRRSFGRRLAIDAPCPTGEAVISVPDSSNTAALGFSQESGIPFELGLIRNHYIGRTFIQPVQGNRDISALIKYNPVRNILKGKSIVVVDDSIVRGTTSRKLIGMIREAGAREVHMRVASPPIVNPCYYGVDTPKRDRLIAASKSVPEIKDYLGVDSLSYLSVNSMMNIELIRDIGLCMACSGEPYPVL